MATGTEILGYRGNAANAGGYTGDGNIAGFGADSLNPLNRTLDSLAQRNTIWNMQQYRQKIEDRDSIGEAISQNKIDFEVDDIYRPDLEQQIDKIKKIRLATPDIKSNPQAWSELQGEIQKFQQMASSAKTNTATLKTMIQEYANNPDQRYRQMLGQHIDGQRGMGVLHNVQPYQKMQDWTPSIFGVHVVSGEGGKLVMAPMFQSKELGRKRFRDNNGVWQEAVAVGSDLGDFERFYTPQVFGEGENKNLPDEARVFQQFSLNSPEFMNDATLSMINAKLDEVNELNNLTPDSPRYLNHIADKDASGQWVPNDTNPIDFVKKVAIGLQYQTPKRKDEVDKNYMGALKTNADINQSNASAEASRASAAKNYWEIEEGRKKLPFELDKMKAEADKFRRENNVTNLQGLEATRAVTQLIQETNPQEFYSLTKNSKVAGPNSVGIPGWKIIQEAGVSDGAEIRTIPLGNQAVQKGMLQPVLKDGKVQKAEKPLKAYMIRDGQEIKFVGVYKGKADGDPLRIVSFNPETMATSYISATNNFVTTDKDQAAKEYAVGRISGIFNGTTDQITETQESTTTTTETKSAIQPGTRRSAGGRTFEFDGKGWFEVQ